MNVEKSRLGTFRKWPANATVDPARLAKAGFYYTGHSLEVQCFMCDVKISDWNYSDQAMVRHRMKSPNCPFVVAPTSTCNVPLVPALADSAAAESTTHQLQLSDPEQSSSENSPSVPQRSMALIREYGTFEQRLLSFENWPKTDVIDPKALAKAGFYYLQNKDMVECAFCRGILMNWKYSEDPDKSHRLNFPNCDFYLRHSPTDEVFKLVSIVPETIQNETMTELGIQKHEGPYKPEYATYKKRLQTFRGWPKDLKQTPEMLAEAGFYYSGYEDQVRCFYCDGGLRTWQPTDDVWIEHARWFEKCGFVILIRGHDFVKHCISNRTPLDLSIITGVPEEDNATEISVESFTSRSREPDTSTSMADVTETSVASCPTVSQFDESNTTINVTNTMVTSPSTVLQPSVSITNAAVEKLLETAPAKAALEIGLHVGRVKRALKKRMERVGKPYMDVVQLIQDVLHDQVTEEDNMLEESTSSSPTSELNNLFDQVTMQITANSTNENNTQQSNVFERNFEKRKMDNEELDDLMSLREENRKLKEARLCKVCMDHDLAVVFLPCGHLATCNHCAPVLTNCPLCRLQIRAYVRIFLS
ncbi:putative inhibitor of apoptosis [Monomorium pharaonis]|uniref:putative inhibitor of apoptosis n=1 Tax=Monomorium pharaonis TaxID=307658 RepID=UPI00063F48F9|nr:putative inhibitor of apoptosis [Monomorium pharaonis]